MKTKAAASSSTSPISETDVIILCGGLGTRLRAVVSDRPKPMARVGDKPFLEILIDHFAARGLRRFILCAGYKAGSITEYFKNSSDRTFVFSQETEPLGTAGALKLCESKRESQTALVLNGDSFCAVDPAALLALHAQKKAAATLSAVAEEKRADGGTLNIAPDGRVTAFREGFYEGRERFINAGVYAFGQQVFDAIAAGTPCSLEKEILPRLLDSGVYAYVTGEKLYDIGTPERLETFQKISPRNSF